MFLDLKRCAVIVFILWFSVPFYAMGQIAWWHAIGSPGSGENAEQHVVHNGDIYVCGYFEQSVVIGNATLTSKGESDIFLYKANPNGAIVWAKSLGGSSYDGDVGLGVDPDGNVYLAGGFIDKLHLDDSVILDAGNANWNSFFSKFDQNGKLLWAKGILAESQYSQVRVWGNISVNRNSFIVATQFSGSISVDGLAVPGSDSDSYLLIAKFDLEGNLIWSKVPDGARDCRKIFLDEEGMCYLTGPFVGTVQFDSYSLTGNSNYSDVYLTKLDQDGETLWLKGGIKTGSRIDNNWSSSFTVDPDGNVYLLGVFKGSVAFDQVILQGNTDPEYSIVDTFLAKYDADGQVIFVVNYGNAYNAFGTDIVNSSFGLFILGSSAGSGQYFYSVVDTDNLQNSDPVYIEGYGLPGQLSVVDEKTFYISGYAWKVEDQMAKGDLDGVLIKVGVCVAPAGAVSPIAGGIVLCPGDEVTYSVDPVENATHFVWMIPPIFTPNGSLRTSENEITLNVSSDGSASISVYAENECNRGKSTSALNIKVDDYLETPLITKDLCDRGLSIATGENIQWLRDNQLLAGQTTASIVVADPGVYKVKIHNACYAAESLEVSVDPIDQGYEPFFPNVITPNNDSRNDSFHLSNSLLQSKLRIFNRWGELVYQSYSYENSWQGEDLSPGIYFYTVENPCFANPFKGSVRVIK